MKGDFTKSTFQPEKHYTSVRMQQGRLQLDADWNEQVDILAYLNQTQVKDIIGVSGVPETNGGFAISATADGKDLTISAGHIYVNGILCELEKPINYKNQPDYPNVPAIDNNTYVVYLDVWQRHITAIEDPDIREIALTHVPDTATRTKIVCQVKLIPQSEWEDFLQKRENRQVNLTAHVKSYSGLGSAIAGDQGLENQLYRVEIHKVDNKGTQFKWSRDNGSTVSAITDIKNNTILIKNFGREDLQFFTAGQWIEVTDETRELQNRPGTLARLTSVTSDGKLTFDPDTEDGDGLNADRITLENFPLKDNRPKVRRWDNNSKADTAAIPIDTAEWIPLEAGIEVKFNQNDFYQPGDYWQFPVRAEQRIKEIPWSDKLQPSQGIQHHYCALAEVTFDGTAFQNVHDQRIKFDTLSKKSTVLENKLDTTGGVLTGSLGVGVKEQQEILARLYIQGEASKTGTGTISSPQNGTQVIGSGTFFQKELHAGDIITADGQIRAIAISDNPPGTFTVNLPWTAEIPQGTHFNYQPPIAHFVSSNGATQLIINALGNLGIGTLVPTEKLEVVGKVKTTNLEVTSGFTADTFTGNHLQISGDSNIAGILSVGNNLTVSTNLNVTGTSQSDTFIGNHLQINDDSNITGVLSVGNNLNVTGRTATANLNVTETSQADTFTGNSLQISGDSNIAGILSVGNNVNVTGTSQADTFTGNSLQISGDSNIAGILSVGNNVNVTGTSQADTFTGNSLQISGDSNIAGILSVGNNVNVTGTSQADTFTGNNLQINGNASLGIGEQPARLYIQGSPAINTLGSNVTSLKKREIQVQGNSALELHAGDFITAAGETRLITQTNPLTINNAFSNELNQAAFTHQQPNIRIAASDGETQLVITAQNKPDSEQGKVSVGILGSDTKLEVESDVDITGNLTALSLAQSSSRKLKENIVELPSEDVVKLLNLLNPMKFNYKNDESKKEHAGFIAEDIPELFTSADKTAINLLDIIAVLTKVVKDQQKTIAIISQFVRAHQTTIQTLSEKVKKLEETKSEM
jgi:Family of unknown function (DUF6519)/Chaperone of endosialidase